MLKTIMSLFKRTPGKINLKTIKKLNPCSNRFDNYVKHYGDRSFTKAQFMGLKNITQKDNLWVSLRLMPKENIALAAADIAESVLPIFEDKYPNDDRPRKAIEASRAKDPKAAAYAAADADADAYAADAYAADAADAAAYAAYVAVAYAAAHAAHAADAANAAATYAAYAVPKEEKPKQEKLIRKIIMRYWK